MACDKFGFSQFDLIILVHVNKSRDVMRKRERDWEICENGQIQTKIPNQQMLLKKCELQQMQTFCHDKITTKNKYKIKNDLGN